MIDFGVTKAKQKALAERMAACGLREEDLEERAIHGSGPGGQSINKNATCVVLRHRPSGLQVRCQESRSQLLNRFLARRRLCELVEAQRMGLQSRDARRQARIRKQKDRRRRRRRSRDT